MNVPFGDYEVWAITRLSGADCEHLVRVTLKAEGLSDTVIDCPKDSTPAIGSTITLGWQ